MFSVENSVFTERLLVLLPFTHILKYTYVALSPPHIACQQNCLSNIHWPTESGKCSNTFRRKNVFDINSVLIAYVDACR